MGYLKNRDETIRVLTSAGWPMPDVYRLFRLAATAERLNEARCNRELSASEDQRDIRNDEAVDALARAHGCQAALSGDPRGYAVKILIPLDAHGKRRANTWGGQEHGWGIPTR